MSDPANLIGTAEKRLVAAHEELERAIELLDELAAHAGYADTAPVVRAMVEELADLPLPEARRATAALAG